MRFGLCTDVDNIEVAQRLGFAYIECYAAGLASMTEEEFERAKAAAEQSSIHVECFNGLFPGDFSLLGARDDDRLRRYLDALFARVEAFRAPLVVFGRGKARSCPEGMDFAEGCRQLAEITQIMGEVAEPHGITIAIEPLNQSETNMITSVGEAAMLAAWIHRPNVKVLADGFHMFKEGESMNNIRRVGELAHTHIATREGRRYPLEKDPLLEEFFRALADMGYDGRMSIEGGTDNLEEDGARAIATLRELEALAAAR